MSSATEKEMNFNWKDWCIGLKNRWKKIEEVLPWFTGINCVSQLRIDQNQIAFSNVLQNHQLVSAVIKFYTYEYESCTFLSLLTNTI